MSLEDRICDLLFEIHGYFVHSIGERVEIEFEGSKAIFTVYAFDPVAKAVTVREEFEVELPVVIDLVFAMRLRIEVDFEMREGKPILILRPPVREDESATKWLEEKIQEVYEKVERGERSFEEAVDDVLMLVDATIRNSVTMFPMDFGPPGGDIGYEYDPRYQIVYAQTSDIRTAHIIAEGFSSKIIKEYGSYLVPIVQFPPRKKS